MGKRGCAALLAVIVLFSTGATGVTFAGDVSGQEGIEVEIDNEVVEPGDQTTVTLSGDAAEHLRIVGDTDGWTLEDKAPVASLLGNPTEDDAFPYESGAETWFYAESPQETLTIDLRATVPEGSYQFTGQQLDTADNVVSEANFTIHVESDEQTADDTVDEGESDGERPGDGADQGEPGGAQGDDEQASDHPDDGKSDQTAEQDDREESSADDTGPGFGPGVALVSAAIMSIIKIYGTR